MNGHTQTLCWDCAKACGGCSWSDYFDHRPVEGWTAVETRLRLNSDVYTQSWIVISCPEFERDAYAGGAKRTKNAEAWAEAALRRKHD